MCLKDIEAPAWKLYNRQFANAIVDGDWQTGVTQNALSTILRMGQA